MSRLRDLRDAIRAGLPIVRVGETPVTAYSSGSFASQTFLLVDSKPPFVSIINGDLNQLSLTVTMRAPLANPATLILAPFAGVCLPTAMVQSLAIPAVNSNIVYLYTEDQISFGTAPFVTSDQSFYNVSKTWDTSLQLAYTCPNNKRAHFVRSWIVNNDTGVHFITFFVTRPSAPGWSYITPSGGISVGIGLTAAVGPEPNADQVLTTGPIPLFAGDELYFYWHTAFNAGKTGQVMIEVTEDPL